MIYENRMVRPEYRDNQEIVRDLERILQAQENRNKQKQSGATKPKPVTGPPSRGTQTQTWLQVNAVLNVKRKQLALLAV
jgi:hypothetical protein